jgi:hypothetical protein
LNIAFDQLGDDEVLFFIRLQGKKIYFDNYYPPTFLEKFTKLKLFRTISEYKYDADVVIDINKYTINDVTTEDYNLIHTVIDIDEVFKRCRGLRSIDYHEAKDLVYRCSKYFINYFKHTNLKLIVAGTVDNYVMDIMFRFAKHFEIRCLGITYFFLSPEYTLVTNYGEHNDFREPTEEEVNRVYANLREKKKSQLAISSHSAHKNAVRYFLSFYYRYIFRYLIRYKLMGKLAYEYRFAPYLKIFHKFNQLFIKKYFDKIDLETVKQNPDQYVYMPLHWYPEATIDYWTDHSDKADYYGFLFEVITFFKAKNVKVILKEHPAFLFCREISTYKKLKNFENVILLNPFVSTQYLSDFIENVVVWNGSTGIESLMLNKKVFVTTEGYYSNYKLPSYKEFGTDAGKNFNFTDTDKKEMIRYILRTSLKVN